MKPFDLEKALAGESVVTRDGRDVSQLNLFFVNKDRNQCPLVGVVDNDI